LGRLGKGIFMPDIFSWQLTLPVMAVILIAWYLVVVWNEKTDKLVIF
jgi:hypothetical protein